MVVLVRLLALNVEVARPVLGDGGVFFNGEPMLEVQELAVGEEQREQELMASGCFWSEGLLCGYLSFSLAFWTRVETELKLLLGSYGRFGRTRRRRLESTPMIAEVRGDEEEVVGARSCLWSFLVGPDVPRALCV